MFNLIKGAIFLLLLISSPLYASSFGQQIDFLASGVLTPSGKVLSYGKVYTYSAGTTSASATWADRAKTTQNTNPIILNLRGQALAFGDGAYKFVIKDADNNLISTYDGLSYFNISSTLVQTTTVNAATSSGLYLTDDGGNLGVFVKDGGFVGIHEDGNPLSALSVANSDATSYTSTLNVTTGGSDIFRVRNIDPSANYTSIQLETGISPAIGRVILGKDAVGESSLYLQLQDSSAPLYTKEQFKLTSEGDLIVGNSLSVPTLSFTTSVSGNIASLNSTSIYSGYFSSASSNITSLNTSTLAASTSFTTPFAAITSLNSTTFLAGTSLRSPIGVITSLNTSTFASNSAVISGAITGVTTLGMSGQLTNTLSTGSAPFVVSSTTKVGNLNADFLDDQTGAYYTNASNLDSGTVPSARVSGGYSGITSLGTLTGLTVAGTATITTVSATSVSATNLSGTLSTAAQPNITNLGTLTSLQVDNLNLDGNTLASTSGAVNITPLAGQNLNITGSGAGDFAVNTNQLYVDTSAAAVGIGTTDPSSYSGLLALVGGTSTQLAISGGSSSGQGSMLRIQKGTTSKSLIGSSSVVVGGSASDDLAIYDVSNANIVFGTNSLERVRIASSNGNVGIGITSPICKLDVNGDIKVLNGSKFFARTPTGGAECSISALIGSTARMELLGADGFSFQTESGGSFTSAMLIDDNQRVGINMTPARVLDVTGTFGATGAATLGSTLALSGNLDINTNKFNVTASNGNTAIAGGLSVAGDITGFGNAYSEAWQDYSGTSTVTGWSSTTTKKIMYKRIGKTVFVMFHISGTSNSTSTSFTLSSAAATLTGSNVFIQFYAVDNGGTAAMAYGTMPAGGPATFTANKDLSGGSWTSSGTKTIHGQFFYETD